MDKGSDRERGRASMYISISRRAFAIFMGLMVLGVPLATLGLYLSNNDMIRYLSAGIVSFGVPLMGLRLLDGYIQQNASERRPRVRIRTLIWLLAAIGLGFIVFVITRVAGS